MKSINPDKVVAYGAAILAAVIEGNVREKPTDLLFHDPFKITSTKRTVIEDID